VEPFNFLFSQGKGVLYDHYLEQQPVPLIVSLSSLVLVCLLQVLDELVLKVNSEPRYQHVDHLHGHDPEYLLVKGAH